MPDSNVSPLHHSPIQNVSGMNVYAVLRAPRASGVEAMVFAVDMKEREAIAMMMAYAAFARGS